VSYLRKVMLFGAVLSAYAWAGPTGTGLDHCPQIGNDNDRLACFDREFAVLAQQRKPALPTAPGLGATAAPPGTANAPAKGSSGDSATTPATPAAAQLTPEQAMGLAPGKILKLQKSHTGTELKELDARIQGISVSGSGRGVFRLDNGQVWQQVEPDSKFEVHPGDTVRITKALLGSFFMSASTHMNTRVSRLE
jgi:hypothetical protein